MSTLSSHLTQPPVRPEHRIGAAAFLALFPGFFFYHTLLGLGRMGAVLGGFFAPVSLLAVPPLLFIYVYRIRHERLQFSRHDLYFNLYILYFMAIVGVNALGGGKLQIVGNHVLGILFIVNLFFIFKFTDFSQPALRRVLIACLFAMSAIVFAYSVDGSFYLAPLGAAKNPESLATYQGFSRSYLLTFAVVATHTRARLLRVILYGLAAPTLFVNTARSEFVAMLAMVPIIELYYARRKLLMAVVFGVLIALLYVNIDALLSLLPSNRILELLDLSQSTSANKRHHLSLYAWQTITHYPLLGDYASYQPGLYSHNVLSAWVDTGLFGFVFVLGLLAVPVAAMLLNGFFHPARQGDFLLGFAIACITLLLLVTSHYFTDMFIGAALGSFARYSHGKKLSVGRPSDLRPSAPRYPDFREAVPGPGTAGL